MEHLSMLHALVCVHALLYATAFLFFSLSIGTAHGAVFLGLYFACPSRLYSVHLEVTQSLWRPSQPGGDTVHLV